MYRVESDNPRERVGWQREEKKNGGRPGAVAQACNSSYLRRGDQEDDSMRTAWAK
jgi:hypothetical protein